MTDMDPVYDKICYSIEGLLTLYIVNNHILKKYQDNSQFENQTRKYHMRPI